MSATASTTTGLILAIDLGKYKSVACCNEPATAQARFDTFTTSRAELQKIFQGCQPAIAVFEACPLAGGVDDLATELGLPCKAANTSSEAWKFKHTKGKADKDDAIRLAQLESLGRVAP